MSGVDERVETVRKALIAYGELAYAFAQDGQQQAQEALAALDSLAAAVADAEQRADELEDALVEVGGGWRDAETPPCYCAGDSTTESLARCTRIRNLLTPLAAAVVSAEPTEAGEQG